MKLDGESEDYIKSIELDHKIYISDIQEAGKKLELPEAYLTIMDCVFNSHINKFNDPDLDHSELIWGYQAPPLMVWVKEEVLSDMEQDGNKDARINPAKEKEELIIEARDKATSSNNNSANHQILCILCIEDLVGNKNSHIPIIYV
ncbi:hypothetical protein R1flu_026262 [Riccia fluitans]|uniref:Uncharacterized protein n=1 Tax=Riccia fluitans TaxID=41844 RepID=A0ABD1XFF5_9MARC